MTNANCFGFNNCGPFGCFPNGHNTYGFGNFTPYGYGSPIGNFAGFGIPNFNVYPGNVYSAPFNYGAPAGWGFSTGFGQYPSNTGHGNFTPWNPGNYGFGPFNGWNWNTSRFFPAYGAIASNFGGWDSIPFTTGNWNFPVNTNWNFPFNWNSGPVSGFHGFNPAWNGIPNWNPTGTAPSIFNAAPANPAFGTTGPGFTGTFGPTPSPFINSYFNPLINTFNAGQNFPGLNSPIGGPFGAWGNTVAPFSGIGYPINAIGQGYVNTPWTNFTGPIHSSTWGCNPFFGQVAGFNTYGNTWGFNPPAANAAPFNQGFTNPAYPVNGFQNYAPGTGASTNFTPAYGPNFQYDRPLSNGTIGLNREAA